MVENQTRSTRDRFGELFGYIKLSNVWLFWVRLRFVKFSRIFPVDSTSKCTYAGERVPNGIAGRRKPGWYVNKKHPLQTTNVEFEVQLSGKREFHSAYSLYDFRYTKNQPCLVSRCKHHKQFDLHT